MLPLIFSLCNQLQHHPESSHLSSGVNGGYAYDIKSVVQLMPVIKTIEYCKESDICDQMVGINVMESCCHAWQAIQQSDMGNHFGFIISRHANYLQIHWSGTKFLSSQTIPSVCGTFCQQRHSLKHTHTHNTIIDQKFVSMFVHVGKCSNSGSILLQMFCFQKPIFVHPNIVWGAVWGSQKVCPSIWLTDTYKIVKWPKTQGCRVCRYVHRGIHLSKSLALYP